MYISISLHLVLNHILPFPAGNNGRCLVGGVSHRSVVLAESILLTLVTDVRSVVPWPVKTHSYPEFKGFPCVDNVGRFWTVSTSCNRRNDKRLQQEAQLPQRNSASAATSRGGGLDPQVHSPSSRYIHLCVLSNPKATTYVRQACRPQSAL